MSSPDPNTPFPLPDFPQVCFIKNVVKNPKILIGDYTYYDDPEDATQFERRVLYHYPFSRDRLIIGKFCAIARGVTFIMNDANHKMTGFSTYPFEIFGHGWEQATPSPEELPFKGDTVVGNDVWLGYASVIMPGITIGDGAIIAAKAVVTRPVPPYTIVGGNPAQVIRQRFSEDVIQQLLAIAWWNWELDKISRNLDKIVGADIAALQTCE